MNTITTFHSVRLWRTPVSRRTFFAGTITIATGFVFLLSANAASAATYYFSSCATGGVGTITNPYCVDPAGNGQNISFGYLMNGASPELSAGDTVNLCAGACDGSGTATYNLSAAGTNNEGDSYAIAPQVSGTASAPITIETYPGETVILSGDTNANSAMDSGDVGTLLTNDTSAAGGMGWYVWKNIIFERSRSYMMNLRAGPDNWNFDNIEVRYTGNMWNGGDYVTNGCDANVGSAGL